LLQFKTSRDHVGTLLDDQGNAHVIIAAASDKKVQHAVVSPDGIVQLELVESGSSPSAISAAFDSEAKLHILLDDRHLVRYESTWKVVHDTPWEAAGIKVRKPRLVQRKKGLVWAFLVDGQEVGAKGRWDWYGFGGGFGAGIIFPWHSASEKLVMVPEISMAESLWYVLDSQDNLDTSNAMLAVDGNENLHVVYDAARGGMAASGQPRYARVSLIPPTTPSDGSSDKRTDRKQLYSFSGSQIPWLGPERKELSQATSAVDPTSGTVLIVRANDASYALTENNWSLPLKLPLSFYFEPKLVPAGGDAFHLMTSEGERVLYLLYAQGKWSAPVELGQANVASGSRWGALGIAGHGRNRAFVVWPTKTGIVGRWIEGAREFQALPGGGADKQAGATAIPEHLLEFANGEAELITPGWTTGIAAAAAAETNGLLTKQLHDRGQWKTLATVVLKDNYGDNLRWYYLGRAAEGMGLCDTAEHYYRISKERSERFETRCLSIVCRGFKFPEILEEHLNAVGAMRSTGKCSVPPRTNH
jgi:hypothetical protein